MTLCRCKFLAAWLCHL